MVRRILGLALAALVLGASCSQGADGESFRTQDGFLLEGRAFGEGEVGVVLSHMFPADQGSWRGFAQELADQGYLALTYNFRGYGDSEGEKRISMIARDVAAAVKHIRELGADQVVLIGASMGGSASLIAAGELEVDGVATLSAPAEFRGLDAMGAVRSVAEPMLFIAALSDEEAARSARGFLKAAPASDLELLGGDAHGTDLLEGSRGEKVRDMLKSFVRDVTSG